MIKFRILGSVEMCDQEGNSVDISGLQRRALFALLLLNAGKTVSCEQLISELWPSGVPSCGGNALQAHMTRLRRDLERCFGAEEAALRLPGSRSGYSVHVDPGELDLEVFNTLRSRAREISESDPAEAADMLRRALALWRGPALYDVRDRTSCLYAAALQEEEHYALTLEELVELDLGQGKHEQLIGWLKALTERYPYREKFFEQLIVALGRTGRKVEAASLFRRMRSEMVEQFGVDPSTRLSRAVQRMLEDDLVVEGDFRSVEL
ncbi:AfsR/SARP family transcriptional regulator [Actinopolyspora alba]|uniref:AfsR/SARP family transcriptional regulator n=1 Tax=Actinopolyspora alba TaxID=673379 RepID=UPI001FE0C302|nr:AfsR/SARP family transcriptional regulator [Actinopolyspora alba]